jgi:glyoxylase I family protein
MVQRAKFKGGREKTMLQYNGIHHASVLVGDTDRALVFYRDILGLEIDPNRPDLGYPGAWLQIGTAQIHLLQLPNPEPARGHPQHPGRDRHLALSIKDLTPLKAALEQQGIPYTASRSGRNALFCRDPDGNGLEFVQVEEKPG